MTPALLNRPPACRGNRSSLLAGDMPESGQGQNRPLRNWQRRDRYARPIRTQGTKRSLIVFRHRQPFPLDANAGIGGVCPPPLETRPTGRSGPRSAHGFLPMSSSQPGSPRPHVQTHPPILAGWAGLHPQSSFHGQGRAVPNGQPRGSSKDRILSATRSAASKRK